MSRPVLVTGATGGLGIGLVEHLLTRGIAVRATGRDAHLGQKLTAMGAEFIAGDLCDHDVQKRLCQGIDIIYHVAALSSPWGAYADFKRINVTATQSLLHAAKQSGARGMVFVSSPSVYAREADQIGLTEQSPINPKPMNAYCATKGEAERLVIAAHSGDFATCAIRPRAIFGADDTVIIPRILRLMRKGTVPMINGGHALIEPTHVSDVAQALLASGQRLDTVGGEVINISGGQAKSLRAMVELMAKALSLRVRFVALPYGFMRMAATLLETLGHMTQKEPPITVYGLTTLAFSQTFDLTKARTLIDYSPQFDPYEAAIERARALMKIVP